MIPLPGFGLHFIILATFIGSIFTAISTQLSLHDQPNTLKSNEIFMHRLENGLLIFSGVFGAGALFYYVGRSHWEVLVAIFPAWIFSLMLLSWKTFQQRQNWGSLDQKEKLIRLIPYSLLFMGYIYLIPQAFSIPSPVAELRRLALNTEKYVTREKKLLEIIRAHTLLGEKIGIIYPLSHLLAYRAKVVNVFPFSQNGSLALISQIQMTLQAFNNNSVSTVFGDVPTELENQLIENGFKKIGAFEDFIIWKR